MWVPEQAAKDYRTDADLHAACELDAKQLCAGVQPGEGRVQDCLRDKAVSVSWECQEELFRQVSGLFRTPGSSYLGLPARQGRVHVVGVPGGALPAGVRPV